MKRANIPFPVRVLVPFVLVAFSLVACGAFVFWVAKVVDDNAIQRERRIVEFAITRARKDIAHDQEGSTFWDEAVVQTSMPGNDEWINENLGSWMHDYFGMDELYIVNGDDKPTYAFADERIQAPGFFTERPNLSPILGEMRAALAEGLEPEKDSREMTIGIADFTFIDGRPALVSLKPITSDKEEEKPRTDSPFIHIAVQYLDGKFIADMAETYGLDGLKVVIEQRPNSAGGMIADHRPHDLALKFNWAPFSPGKRHDGADGVAIDNRVGDPTIAFEWIPFRPGKDLVTEIFPILLIVAASIMAGTLLLSWSAYRRRLDRVQSERRIRHMASHDALTGLPNRAAYEKSADQLAAQIKQRSGDEQAAFLYMDIDRFKQVNDLFGHQAGDHLLIEFAKRVQNVIPENAHLYRLGGDEFTVLMSPCSQSEAESLSSRIIGSLAVPFDLGGTCAFVGVSIGVSLAPLHGTDRHELTRKADVALYHAKAAGRGWYSVFGIQMDNKIKSQAIIEADLRLALRDKTQLSVHYQPKFDSDCHRIRGVEALVRWNHPERGMIPPSAFVPIAESCGLIRELGLWVLDRACREAIDWPIDQLAVNVSPKQLQDVDLVPAIAEILEATGFPANRLEIEITESALKGPAPVAVGNIRRLIAMGIAVAMDDFGTGSSTFERLKEIEFDRIKIDQSFIKNIHESRSDTEIVRAMITLAHAKGLKTTAEGVETIEQRDILIDIGCDELQGYLFCRPVNPEKIMNLFVFNADGIIKKALALG